MSLFVEVGIGVFVIPTAVGCSGIGLGETGVSMAGLTLAFVVHEIRKRMLTETRKKVFVFIFMKITCPTVCVTRWWAGGENAWEQYKPAATQTA